MVSNVLENGNQVDVIRRYFAKACDEVAVLKLIGKIGWEKLEFWDLNQGNRWAIFNENKKKKRFLTFFYDKWMFDIANYEIHFHNFTILLHRNICVLNEMITKRIDRTALKANSTSNDNNYELRPRDLFVIPFSIVVSSLQFLEFLC